MKYRKLFIFILMYFLFLHQSHIYASSSAKIFLEEPNNYGQIQTTHLNEIPRELKSLICHNLSDPQDLYSVSLLNNEHAKLIKEQIEAERIHTFNNLPKERMNRYLRTLCEAPLQDLWLLRLEMRLAQKSLSKIRNSDAAYKYVKDAKRYFKHSQRGSVGQPLENLHLYKCIYNKSLLLFKKFADQFPEEHKFLYSRLLLYASRLQSQSEKSKAIKNMQYFRKSQSLGVYADYYLLSQDKKAKNEEFENLDARISCYIFKDYKLLKLQFNLADHCFNSIDIFNKHKDFYNKVYIKFQECQGDASLKLEDILRVETEDRESINEVQEDSFFEKLLNLNLYKSPNVNQCDITKTLKIFIMSIYKMGSICYSYFENEVDKEYGISLLKILADYGHAYSQFMLGSIYFENKQYDVAFKYSKMAAEGGLDNAMCYVAGMYFKGEGVKRDYQQAFDWYKRATRYNMDIAQYYIGMMYEKGLGVEANYQQALKWYCKALTNGCEIANFNIGWFYDKGLGVKRNTKTATQFYSNFSKINIFNNHPFTWPVNLIKNMHEHFIANMFRYELGREKYPQAAVDIYRYLAKENYGLSQASLGRLYKEGWAVFSDRSLKSIIEPPNLEFAKVILNQACEQDEAAGYYNLALMYRDGEGVEQDDREACGLLSLAAVQMQGDALYTLGWMYEQGRGVDKDLEKANYLYREGRKRYPADAFYSLGRMYELGLSVPKDINEAIKWYRKAADLYYNDAEEKLASLENNNFNNLKKYFY